METLMASQAATAINPMKAIKAQLREDAVTFCIIVVLASAWMIRVSTYLALLTIIGTPPKSSTNLSCSLTRSSSIRACGMMQAASRLRENRMSLSTSLRSPLRYISISSWDNTLGENSSSMRLPNASSYSISVSHTQSPALAQS